MLSTRRSSPRSLSHGSSLCYLLKRYTRTSVEASKRDTMGYIYMIKNKLNGKLYIGQTRRTVVQIRWRQHKTRMEHSRTPLYNALRKYGLDNFEFKIVCICFDCDLDRFEVQYIKRLDTLITGNGYNIQEGGNSRAWSIEAREAQSARKIGTKHTLEARKRMSQARLGNKNTLGHTLTEEHKEKLRRNAGRHWQGKHLTPEHKAKLRAIHESRMQPVVQYDKAGKFIANFKSIAAAAASLGVDDSPISRNCRGKQKTSYGFVWKFKEPVSFEP